MPCILGTPWRLPAIEVRPGAPGGSYLLRLWLPDGQGAYHAYHHSAADLNAALAAFVADPEASLRRDFGWLWSPREILNLEDLGI